MKSIFNYQLINRLIEGRRNYQQNGKCLIEFYNSISNQTQFDSVFLDFNQNEFKSSLNSLYRMLNYSLNSTTPLKTSYLTIDPPKIIYKHSPLLAYYFNISSSIISSSSPRENQTIILDIEILDSTVQHQFNNWKRIKLINRLHRRDELLKNYELLVLSEIWQQHHLNTCVLVSFNENYQSIRVKRESWQEPRRLNFGLKQSIDKQILKFYYYNDLLVYLVTIFSACVLLFNMIVYFVNYKKIMIKNILDIYKNYII